MAMHPAVVGLSLSLLLTACAAPERQSGLQRYDDPAGDFHLDIPLGVAIRRDFTRDYFSEGRWKAYAAPDSQGQPRVALVLPGSNAVTRAELRVGISQAARDLRECLQAPEGLAPAGTDRRLLDGVTFTHFRAGDAAMSHYQEVEAYRALHDGRCYAIDLWIGGVRPEVYDPPAVPPFTNEQARQELERWLQGFHF